MEQPSRPPCYPDQGHQHRPWPTNSAGTREAPTTPPILPKQGASTPYADHAVKRSPSASLLTVVLALISAFSAGSAIGFATQKQIAEGNENRATSETSEIRARVNTLTGNLMPHEFLNA